MAGATGYAAAPALAEPIDGTGPAAAGEVDPGSNPGVAVDELQPLSLTSDIGKLLETANAGLRSLGVQPFLIPTAAAFCSQIPGVPLGIVPGVAGAIPGPYTPILGDLTVLGLDLNAVKSGQVLYGFAPAGIGDDSETKSGMSVAWLNMSNFQGGINSMGSPTDVIVDGIARQAADLGPIVEAAAAPFIKMVSDALNSLPQAGIRAATVDTGQGLVLSMVVGSVSHSSGTCYFLPTVGIQNVG
ncbi:hypothetical protein [Nocardia seriolae]|nr:hypothetical protein [Nocardia seriolae]MTJ61551.1 hypothetical protein [Nocardia seriolae]MTJ76524.1 hypothetical protein [Nocardia seriolae]MTJ86577.1 hypothetical protein [Nocardia seriolae]MTK30573.1 hypothetical protein [Nocardia seriolae]MTK39521.1 hypothetical protein [Nocardia seriolae]